MRELSPEQRVDHAMDAHEHFNMFLDSFLRHMDKEERNSFFDCSWVKTVRGLMDTELSVAYRRLGEKVAHERRQNKAEA